jgi:hypothetical protein
VDKPEARPDPIGTSIVPALSETVEVGSYVRIDDPGQVPAGLADYCGTDFRTCVVAATGVLPEQWFFGTRNAPVDELYLVKIYRYCEHAGTPHWNVDDVLYWSGGDAFNWKIDTKEGPDHYKRALAGTGLEHLSGAHMFPPGYSGVISEFWEKGGFLDFRAVAKGVIRPAGED